MDTLKRNHSASYFAQKPAAKPQERCFKRRPESAILRMQQERADEEAAQLQQEQQIKQHAAQFEKLKREAELQKATVEKLKQQTAFRQRVLDTDCQRESEQIEAKRKQIQENKAELMAQLELLEKENNMRHAEEYETQQRITRELEMKRSAKSRSNSARRSTST